jgi:hypothetical protein
MLRGRSDRAHVRPTPIVYHIAASDDYWLEFRVLMPLMLRECLARLTAPMHAEMSLV